MLALDDRTGGQYLVPVDAHLPSDLAGRLVGAVGTGSGLPARVNAIDAHLAGAALAALLASFVEFLEALTVVLAVGAMRGWRNALTGAGAAGCVLAGMLTVLGPR